MLSQFKFKELEAPGTKPITGLHTCVPTLVLDKETKNLSVVIQATEDSYVLFFDSDGRIRQGSIEYLLDSFWLVENKTVEITFVNQ